MDTVCVKQIQLILGIIQNEKYNPVLIMFQEEKKKKDKNHYPNLCKYQS